MEVSFTGRGGVGRRGQCGGSRRGLCVHSVQRSQKNIKLSSQGRAPDPPRGINTPGSRPPPPVESLLGSREGWGSLCIQTFQASLEPQGSPLPRPAREPRGRLETCLPPGLLAHSRPG